MSRQKHSHNLRSAPDSERARRATRRSAIGAIRRNVAAPHNEHANDNSTQQQRPETSGPSLQTSSDSAGDVQRVERNAQIIVQQQQQMQQMQQFILQMQQQMQNLQQSITTLTAAATPGAVHKPPVDPPAVQVSAEATRAKAQKANPSPTRSEGNPAGLQQTEQQQHAASTGRTAGTGASGLDRPPLASPSTTHQSKAPKSTAPGQRHAKSGTAAGVRINSNGVTDTSSAGRSRPPKDARPQTSLRIEREDKRGPRRRPVSGPPPHPVHGR